MRVLAVFESRPGALLGLGAAVTLIAPSCACGVGALILPPLLLALVRLTLVEALRLNPTRPAAPLVANDSKTTLLSIVVMLGVLALAGISASGALGAALGEVGHEAATSTALLGACAAGALLTPLVFVPYASVERGRGPGDAFGHAARITGTLPWARVALVSSTVPLLAAPFALSAILPLESPMAICIALATSWLLVPLVFCGLGATYAEASERLALQSSANGGAEAPSASFTPSASVALALAGLVGALLVAIALRPSQLEPRDLATWSASTAAAGATSGDLLPSATVRGTSVRLAATARGVRVSVDDGGGAGLIEGVPQPTRYRTTPRRDVCRSCFALEVSNEAQAGRTVLDAGGVRHDDGPTLRLSRAAGLLGWIAIASAFVFAAICALRTRAQSSASAPLLLVIVALLTAVLDLSRAVLR